VRKVTSTEAERRQELERSVTRHERIADQKDFDIRKLQNDLLDKEEELKLLA